MTKKGARAALTFAAVLFFEVVLALRMVLTSASSTLGTLPQPAGIPGRSTRTLGRSGIPWTLASKSHTCCASSGVGCCHCGNGVWRSCFACNCCFLVNDGDGEVVVGLWSSSRAGDDGDDFFAAAMIGRGESRVKPRKGGLSVRPSRASVARSHRASVQSGAALQPISPDRLRASIAKCRTRRGEIIAEALHIALLAETFATYSQLRDEERV